MVYGGNHRRELTAEEQAQQAEEEGSYRDWCREMHLDPEEAQSAVAYDRMFGDIAIEEEPPEDHR